MGRTIATLQSVQLRFQAFAVLRGLVIVLWRQKLFAFNAEGLGDEQGLQGDLGGRGPVTKVSRDELAVVGSESHVGTLEIRYQNGRAII
jgi:hypothetical protein